MAATNQPGVLDGGLIRSGRFDRKVKVGVPDGPEMRLEILALYAQKYINENQLDADIDLMKVAKITDGFVGADLELLFNEAAKMANRAGREKIKMEDFKEAILRIVVGPKKGVSHASQKERETVIGHEFGHAVAALAAQWNLFVVSTTQRGDTLGLVMPSRDGTRLTYRDDALKNMMMTAAGRSAEKYFFGPEKITAGAAGDLQHMENIFRSMMATGLLNDRVVSKYHNPHVPLEERDENTKDDVFNAAIDAGVALMKLIPQGRETEILARLLEQKEDLLNEDAESFVRELLGPDFDWDAAFQVVSSFVGQGFKEPLSQTKTA